MCQDFSLGGVPVVSTGWNQPNPWQVNLAKHFLVAHSLSKSGSKLVTQARLITDLPYYFALWNCSSGTSPPSPSCSLLLHTCCILVRVPRVPKQDFSGFWLLSEFSGTVFLDLWSFFLQSPHILFFKKNIINLIFRAVLDSQQNWTESTEVSHRAPASTIYFTN